MSLRDALNKNPRLATGLAAGIILVAGVAMLWSMMSTGGGTGTGGAGGGVPQRYYTIDDGKTYFPDSYDKVPPFEKDGKQAVIAKVFRDLDNKGDPFVGYLQRYSAAGKKMVEDRLKAAGGGSMAPMEGLAPPVEYKKPGEGNWVSSSDPRAASLINDLKSPKGSVNIEEVFPE